LQRLSTDVGDDYALATYTGAIYSDLDFSARVRRSDGQDQPTFLNIRDNGTRTETDCWCAKGEALSFYINDSLAWQGSSDTHASGNVGIGVVNFSDETSNTLDVEWARLSVPGVSSNLALTGEATQSSIGFSGDPARAIDGDTSGVYNNGSITHTGYQAQPWWQVDLGKQSVMETIRLHNRTDCCSTRLSDVNIFIADDDMSTRTLSELQADGDVSHYLLSGALDTLTEQSLPNTRGRYVRIQLSGTNYLSLAEVEVIGR